MKLAYTGWTWLINHKDNYRWEFEQFLKEVAYLGYEAVENFAFVTKYFDNDPAPVKALLDKYGLEFVNMYEHFTEDPEADYQSAVDYVKFMKEVGVTHLNMQAVMWKDTPFLRPTDEAAIRSFAERSNRIGQLCVDNGITACFHPHLNTAVYTEEEIDLYDSLVDPDLVKLCLDTAHTAHAGIDPVEAFQKYKGRIGYVHLKDLDPKLNYEPEWPGKRFLPLGMGTLDIKGVVECLRDNGYDGVICVELDEQPVCNFHSAMVSRQYLKNVLGM